MLSWSFVELVIWQINEQTNQQQPNKQINKQ
jgi:hypothetical protein